MSARDLTTHDYRFLLADKGTLERMLREAAPDSAAMRISLESRKQQVEEQIAAFEAAPKRLVETHIAFRGGPVKNGGGIEAGFVLKALGAFTDAVATVGIGQTKAPTPYGRLPNRSAYEMVIGNPSGSFGFQIEREFPCGAPPEEADALEAALERVIAIVKASADSDESLADAAAETDERSIRSVRKFLNVMAKADAYCAIEFNGELFRFRDAAHVKQSAARIAPNNIRKSSAEMRGDARPLPQPALRW